MELTINSAGLIFDSIPFLLLFFYISIFVWGIVSAKSYPITKLQTILLTNTGYAYLSYRSFKYLTRLFENSVIDNTNLTKLVEDYPKIFSPLSGWIILGVIIGLLAQLLNNKLYPNYLKIRRIINLPNIILSVLSIAIFHYILEISFISNNDTYLRVFFTTLAIFSFIRLTSVKEKLGRRTNRKQLFLRQTVRSSVVIILLTILFKDVIENTPLLENNIKSLKTLMPSYRLSLSNEIIYQLETITQKIQDICKGGLIYWQNCLKIPSLILFIAIIGDYCWEIGMLNSLEGELETSRFGQFREIYRIRWTDKCLAAYPFLFTVIDVYGSNVNLLRQSSPKMVTALSPYLEGAEIMMANVPQYFLLPAFFFLFIRFARPQGADTDYADFYPPELPKRLPLYSLEENFETGKREIIFNPKCLWQKYFVRWNWGFMVTLYIIYWTWGTATYLLIGPNKFLEMSNIQLNAVNTILTEGLLGLLLYGFICSLIGRCAYCPLIDYAQTYQIGKYLPPPFQRKIFYNELDIIQWMIWFLIQMPFISVQITFKIIIKTVKNIPSFLIKTSLKLLKSLKFYLTIVPALISRIWVLSALLIASVLMIPLLLIDKICEISFLIIETLPILIIPFALIIIPLILMRNLITKIIQLI